MGATQISGWTSATTRRSGDFIADLKRAHENKPKTLWQRLADRPASLSNIETKTNAPYIWNKGLFIWARRKDEARSQQPLGGPGILLQI